ncbi:type II toxin-antitoxin system RelB/DinJ family antitoxin [Paraburkholderia terricola]|jgi:antitoxin component of RelBE/YafQ-DinJ toxin-antitoxin module|uniref:type II toxin-antitoxin system RelB/DinJ family antitoxin n=1 Tax=Paraburkholderia terricola TaxID=169427 RepID=UPI003ECD7214
MSNVTANVSDSVRAAAHPVLEKANITMSEYLRLCIAYVGEMGKLPFEVPETSKGVMKRKLTFFS